MSEELPEVLFRRQDESADARFYDTPRFTTHIDDETISALTDYYRETLPCDGRLLDLMSSWISHLPSETRFSRVSGLGMNREELARNERLDDFAVHDLNSDPVLPYPDGVFDAVTIAVSVQYLVQPFRVFKEIARVLTRDSHCIVAMSHRLFPTKAIYAFHTLSPTERCELVASYLQRTGEFRDIRFIDRSPSIGDPLWIVTGQRT